MIRKKVKVIQEKFFSLFNTSRFIDRISRVKLTIFQAIYIIIIVAFMAGFVNAFFFPVPNQGFIIYPQSGAQSIPETVIDMFVIFLGGLGVYMSYIGGRQTTRARTRNLYLLLSMFIIFISLVIGLYIYINK